MYVPGKMLKMSTLQTFKKQCHWRDILIFQFFAIELFFKLEASSQSIEKTGWDEIKIGAIRPVAVGKSLNRIVLQQRETFFPTRVMFDFLQKS